VSSSSSSSSSSSTAARDSPHLDAPNGLLALAVPYLFSLLGLLFQICRSFNRMRGSKVLWPLFFLGVGYPT
jgi:hypothetical protein